MYLSSVKPPLGIELGVPPGGPNCQVDTTEVVGDLIPQVACDLRTSTGFGKAVVNPNTPIQAVVPPIYLRTLGGVTLYIG